MACLKRIGKRTVEILELLNSLLSGMAYCRYG
jgi:hypothetical protein